MKTLKPPEIKLGVSWKLILPVCAIVLVIVGLQGWLNVNAARQRNEEQERQNLLAAYRNYTNEVQQLLDSATALAISIAGQPNVQDLIVAQNRQELLELLTPTFDQLQRYGFDHLYIHQADGQVFLRVHDREEAGDIVSINRQTTQAVIETGQPAAGIELDPDHLGIRSVAPIFRQNELVGLVEVGVDYDQAFLDTMKIRHSLDYTLWISNEAAEQASMSARSEMPAPSSRLFYYASTTEARPAITEEVYLQMMAVGDPQVHFVSAGDDRLSVLAAPFYGSNNRILGVMEISTSRAPAIAALKSSQRNTLALVAVLALAAIGFMWLTIDSVVLRSLRHLTNVAGRQLAGDLAAQAVLPEDEFGILGNTLNSMTKTIRSSIQDLEHQVEGVRQAEAAAQQEIERRKSMGESLRQERDLVARLMAVSPAGIVVLNREGQITFANTRAEQVLGLQHSEITQRTYNDPSWKITGEQGQPYPDQELPWKQVIDTEQPVYDIRHTIEWPDGQRVYISVNAAPLYDESGQIESVVATVEDISMQKLAAFKEQEHYEWLKRVIEQGKLVTQITDWHSCLYKIREVVCSGLGFDRVGLYVYDPDKNTYFGSYGTDKNGNVIEEWDVEFNFRTQESFEQLVHSPEKYVIWNDYDAQWNFSPDDLMYGVKDHVQVAAWVGEMPVAVISVDNLLTQRPIAEQQIEALRLFAGYAGMAIENARLHDEIYQYAQALESQVDERTSQLQAINKELEAFAYSISHDLRAPLRAIDGYSALLEEDYRDRLSGDAATFLINIRLTTRKMSDLIDGLLRLSRLGRQPLKMQRIDLKALIGQVWAEMEEEWNDRPIELRVDMLPDCDADPILFQQVWVNLISNALKFTRGRNPACIEIGYQPNDNSPVFYIRDNGVGFDSRYADKLFGVFQRYHSIDDYEGHGIGLAIVNRIILRHGGRIWAEAAIDEGATFFFSLPQENIYNQKNS